MGAAFDVVEIRNLIETYNLTHEDVFFFLNGHNMGNNRGLSLRSLKRFCRKHGISSRSKISEETLEAIVGTTVDQLGQLYGYRMVKGYLEAMNVWRVAEKRIQRALQTVDPIGVGRRLHEAHRQLNPKSYHAPYFGYNLHMDQNEKLVDYGIVVVAAIDGHSSFLFDIAVMAWKNNLAIYWDLYLPILQNFGLFQRLIVDFSREFILSLFMQQYYWLILDNHVDELKMYSAVGKFRNELISRLFLFFTT